MGFVCVFQMSNPGIRVKETLGSFVKKTKGTVADAQNSLWNKVIICI